MGKLSEESLNKLAKLELIAFSVNLQERNKSIQHDMKNEVRQFSELLPDRLVSMERQW